VMTNLVRQLGRKRAFELAGLGEPIDGATAERWGLVNRLADADEVDTVAFDLARRMAGYSGRALASTKQLMGEVADLPYAAGLERGRLANIEMRGF
jgi:enoyl-CoA hydratase/carnithine racemase